jgi:hypothetical protein
MTDVASTIFVRHSTHATASDSRFFEITARTSATTQADPANFLTQDTKNCVKLKGCSKKWPNLPEDESLTYVDR